MPGADPLRILFGLDRLPRGVGLDDPRLPSVVLERAPLRLNTWPVPAPVLADAGGGHAARVAALTRWLQALAGDWAVTRRRFVADYLAAAADAIARERDAVASRLARYDGLYQPEDCLWSALRPLPRAWIVVSGSSPVFAEMAFWDGALVHAAGLAGSAPGIVDFVLDGMPDLPPRFWEGDRLPRSPFRRG